MSMMKKSVLCVLLGFIFLLFSCDLISNSKDVSFDYREKQLSDDLINQTKNRKWTILIYMSADNQLESSAIEDLCEMQNSKIDDSKVTILALVDRSNGYNTSNGDWTGTRLYKIKTGNKTNTSELVSEEIDCKPLGLKVGVETELEMSSNYTLSEVLSYVMEKFPADHNGLIIWGHGTGWRSETSEPSVLENAPSYKGFAYDETSGSYMTLKQLGKGLQTALGTNKLDFLGFDTCFSGEIEVAYELRNLTSFFVGTEGLISSSGWNYKKFFDWFSESNQLSPENLCKSAIHQFADQYAFTPRASICAVKTEYLEEYVALFNEFFLCAGDKITSIDIHDQLMGVLYTNKNCNTEKYSYGAEGYDIYLDVKSMVDNTVLCLAEDDLIGIYHKFIAIQEKLYLENWASDRECGGLGVYFSTYGAGGILISMHPSGYINGKTINQIDFVHDCTGYVPSCITSSGLLDSLFYKDFS